MTDLFHNQPRLRQCTSCQAPIIWLMTASGRRMPTEAESVEPADLVFDPARHVSHFATCPNTGKHRNKIANVRARK